MDTDPLIARIDRVLHVADTLQRLRERIDSIYGARDTLRRRARELCDSIEGETSLGDDLERFGRHVGELRRLEGWSEHYTLQHQRSELALERARQLAVLYEHGASTLEIARIEGISPQRVWVMLRRVGVRLRKRGRVPKRSAALSAAVEQSTAAASTVSQPIPDTTGARSAGSE